MACWQSAKEGGKGIATSPSEMETLLEQAFLLLLVTVPVVALFWRLDLPPILAYLYVGVCIGPHSLGWFADNEWTEAIGNLGVLFLMFMLGLEFSLPKLIAMRNLVFGLGAAQMVLTIAVVAGAAWMLGMDTASALVIGAALAMSSTTIVVKQLAEQMEVDTPHSRAAISIALFQDVAVIPLLILVPTLAVDGEETISSALLLAVTKGVAVFLLMLMVGRWITRPVFRAVAKTRSPELFTLTVLLVSMASAWAAHASGLSPVLGVFLAGMLLGETEFRHQVGADIRPFRDVLLGLFFITVGATLNVRILPDQWMAVLALAAAIIVTKAMLIAALAFAAGMPRVVAGRVGLVLAQAGEFGFVLLSLGLSMGLLAEESTQVVLAAMVLTMALSPLLIRHSGRISRFAFGRRRTAQDEAQAAHAVAEEAKELSRHVIICGYGRIGQSVGRFLDSEDLQYFALDLDPQRVQEARAAGFPVSYGDAANRDILEAAGLQRARALVVSFDEVGGALRVLEQVRQLRPGLPVLVRTGDDANLEPLLEAGATEVVPETLEASLMLAFHLLLLLNVPLAQVLRRMRLIRADRYRILREFFPGEEVASLEDTELERARLHTVTLPPAAYAAGRTLGELALEEYGVKATAVRRQGVRALQPAVDTVLQGGDVLIMAGTAEGLERAERRLLQG